MNIRPLESLTKEELIELIKHEREHIADTRKMAPGEWKLVPVEPKNETIEAVKLFSHGRSTTLYKKVTTPTDTEMLDWLIRKNASVEHYPFHPIDDKFLVVNPYDDTLTSASNPREAIAKAMRGEK